MRVFEGGATRDDDAGKLDYEGFLSPFALKAYAEYMHRHRQTDSGVRSSDNWQVGMPNEVYVKSMLRHVMEVWMGHRDAAPVDIRDALCGVLFNAFGLLHQIVKPEGVRDGSDG